MVPDPTLRYVDDLLSIPDVRATCIAISFHSYWSDPSGANENPPQLVDGPAEPYKEIAALGVKYDLPVWVEKQAIGNTHIDRRSWLYAMATAENFWRCITFARASATFHWEFQAGDTYTPADGAVHDIYPVWSVEKSLRSTFGPGTVMLSASSDTPDIAAMAGLSPTSQKLSVILLNLTNHAESATVRGLLPGSYSQSQRSEKQSDSPTIAVTDEQALALPAMSMTVLTPVN